jgi:PadR family transcriptional regulator PadR
MSTTSKLIIVNNHFFFELIVLTLIEVHPTPGAHILARLKALNFPTSPGTLYPLLAGLKKKSIIQLSYEEMEVGHARKCYLITETGQNYLAELKKKWRWINHTIYKAGK